MEMYLRIIEIPANEIAKEVGNEKSANMVAWGVYLEASRIVPIEKIKNSLKEVLPKRHHNLISLYEKAIDKGAIFVKTREKGGK